MDKRIQQATFNAKPGEPVLAASNAAPAPLSESERKVLMNWHQGDVTVGEILAHRREQRLPFGVIRGGLPYKRERQAPDMTPFDGPEAA